MTWEFICPHCEYTEWTSHCIIDHDWRNPLTNYSVTEGFTCKNCKRDIGYSLEFNKNIKRVNFPLLNSTFLVMGGKYNGNEIN